MSTCRITCILREKTKIVLKYAGKGAIVGAVFGGVGVMITAGMYPSFDSLATGKEFYRAHSSDYGCSYTSNEVNCVGGDRESLENAKYQYISDKDKEHSLNYGLFAGGFVIGCIVVGSLVGLGYGLCKVASMPVTNEPPAEQKEVKASEGGQVTMFSNNSGTPGAVELERKVEKLVP